MYDSTDLKKAHLLSYKKILVSSSSTGWRSWTGVLCPVSRQALIGMTGMAPKLKIIIIKTIFFRSALEIRKGKTVWAWSHCGQEETGSTGVCTPWETVPNRRPHKFHLCHLYGRSRAQRHQQQRRRWCGHSQPCPPQAASGETFTLTVALFQSEELNYN